VFSTVPLPALARLVTPPAPQPALDGAARLRFRAMVLVYLVLDRDLDDRVEPAKPVEVEHTGADVTRLHGLLGWVPDTDIERLVARQAAGTVGKAAGLRSAG
jgi:hypothetical protein